MGISKDIITATIIGLVSGIIPGPVLTSTFTEILQAGLAKSFRIILWSLLIESLVGLISLITLSSMHFPESVFYGLSIPGGAILLWISFSIWKVRKIDPAEKVHFGPGKITLMIFSNGILWSFWIMVIVPKALMFNEKLLYGSYLYLIIVEIAWLISTSMAAIAFSRFRKILSDPKVVPVVFKIFALAFVYFSLDMFYKSLSFFLN
jgi:threonine/homoserine/homoserine lactone efflux protein